MRGTPSFPPVTSGRRVGALLPNGPDVAPRGLTSRPGDAGGSVVASGAPAAAHRAAWPRRAGQSSNAEAREQPSATAAGQAATMVLPEN
jgi:hypothetical protein